ncbi:MAG: winged helix-turn-helix domain-containing protein [Yersiniaceae bacterium]|nr:winged helix-turn-helix domain-containing protein [Yersiniaceae bacterium]
MLSLMRFQLVDGVPKVNQLVDFIARTVEEGRLEPGSRLPSLREFCEQLSVSKYTVVDALERLRARGLVTSAPGRGYFISRDSLPGGPVAPAIPATADLHTRLKRAFATNSTLLRPGCSARRCATRCAPRACVLWSMGTRWVTCRCARPYS